MPKANYKKSGNGNGGISELLKELWNAAVALRGNIEPADYKRYVLPLIFLRFLSMRFEKRHADLLTEIADPKSDLHTTDKQLALDILNDADNYTSKQVFLVPEAGRVCRPPPPGARRQRPIRHSPRSHPQAHPLAQTQKGHSMSKIQKNPAGTPASNPGARSRAPATSH